MCVGSDEKFKENIEVIGSEQGIPIVRFNYRGSKHLWKGVIAQAVRMVRPDCVIERPDGLYVNYAKLGIRLEMLT